MNIQTDSRGGPPLVAIDEIPDVCPVCLHSIQPIGLDYAFATDDWVEKTFRCPRQRCSHLFIARYHVWHVPSDVPMYRFHSCIPITIKTTEFGELIENISKDFVEIHRQAETAQARGLTLVCGPGYRKALEFLIKDYASLLHPNDAEQIKRMHLSDCIRTYIKSDRITAVASRAVWLGNDETHYIRKWEDKDMKDLITLIQLTVRWVEMEEMTKSAVADMAEANTSRKAKS